MGEGAPIIMVVGAFDDRATGVPPAELAASVETPIRVIAGGESFPYTRATTTALAQIIPDARARVLEGQTHDIAPHALASVLNDVFAAAR